MCKSNSHSQVCGIPVTTYTDKQSNGIKPTIQFCPTIRGAILHALLARVAHSPSKQPSAPFAVEILSNDALAKMLLSRCNLAFSHGAYPRLIIPAWKNSVKWILRKVVEMGVVKRQAGLWVRDEEYVFGSDELAGKWFNNALASLQTHGVMYASGDEMPDLGRLSLEHLDKKAAAVTKAKLPAKSKVKRLLGGKKPRSALDKGLVKKDVSGARGRRGVKVEQWVSSMSLFNHQS
ncbi:hypothetical protein ACHAQK_012230 [Fusarium lateritium]